MPRVQPHLLEGIALSANRQLDSGTGTATVKIGATIYPGTAPPLRSLRKLCLFSAWSERREDFAILYCFFSRCFRAERIAAIYASVTLSRSWHTSQINKCCSTEPISGSESVPIAHCSKESSEMCGMASVATATPLTTSIPYHIPLYCRSYRVSASSRTTIAL